MRRACRASFPAGSSSASRWRARSRSGPDVLLLDEPLSNLDAKLREEVRIEIRELQRQLGLTTIMVTHDQEEALTVADRLVVMAEGEIRQIGSQRDLYERPADRFVAGFVGRSTFLDGRVTAPGEFETAGGLHLKCRDGAPGRGRAGAAPGAAASRRRTRTGQSPARQGGIRLLSRRRARIARAPVAGRPRGGAAAEPRRGARRRSATTSRSAGIAMPDMVFAATTKLKHGGRT